MLKLWKQLWKSSQFCQLYILTGFYYVPTCYKNPKNPKNTANSFCSSDTLETKLSDTALNIPVIHNSPLLRKHYLWKKIKKEKKNLGGKWSDYILRYPGSWKLDNYFGNVVIEVNIKIYDKLAYDVSDAACPVKKAILKYENQTSLRKIKGKFVKTYSFVFKTVTLENKNKETLVLHFGKATKEKDISLKTVWKIMIYL